MAAVLLHVHPSCIDVAMLPRRRRTSSRGRSDHAAWLTFEASILPARHRLAALLLHTLPNRINAPMFPRRRETGLRGRFDHAGTGQFWRGRHSDC